MKDSACRQLEEELITALAARFRDIAQSTCHQLRRQRSRGSVRALAQKLQVHLAQEQQAAVLALAAAVQPDGLVGHNAAHQLPSQVHFAPARR